MACKITTPATIHQHKEFFSRPEDKITHSLTVSIMVSIVI